jgi:signal peptidase II
MDVRLQARWRMIAVVAAVTLVLDQLTKWWALDALADGHTIPVVWTLQFSLHFNTGAAFSMGSDSGLTRFLPLVVLVVVGVIVWRGRSELGRTGSVAIGLILGGAVGNVVDRAVRAESGLLSGAVVDFIDLQWYPVFNVADMGVVVGGILFALVSLREPGEEDESGGGAEPDDRATAASTDGVDAGEPESSASEPIEPERTGGTDGPAATGETASGLARADRPR